MICQSLLSSPKSSLWTDCNVLNYDWWYDCFLTRTNTWEGFKMNWADTDIFPWVPIRIKLNESRIKGQCIKGCRPSPDLHCVFLTLFTKFNPNTHFGWLIWFDWIRKTLFDLRSQINERELIRPFSIEFTFNFLLCYLKKTIYNTRNPWMNRSVLHEITAAFHFSWQDDCSWMAFKHQRQ